jgi:hypothetical protein
VDKNGSCSCIYGYHPVSVGAHDICVSRICTEWANESLVKSIITDSNDPSCTAVQFLRGACKANLSQNASPDYTYFREPGFLDACKECDPDVVKSQASIADSALKLPGFQLALHKTTGAYAIDSSNNFNCKLTCQKYYWVFQQFVNKNKDIYIIDHAPNLKYRASCKCPNGFIYPVADSAECDGNTCIGGDIVLQDG